MWNDVIWINLLKMCPDTESKARGAEEKTWPIGHRCSNLFATKHKVNGDLYEGERQVAIAAITTLEFGGSRD